MLENIWFIAAFWMGLALLARLISIRLGISVALIESWQPLQRKISKLTSGFTFRIRTFQKLLSESLDARHNPKPK